MLSKRKSVVRKIEGQTVEMRPLTGMEAIGEYFSRLDKGFVPAVLYGVFRGAFGSDGKPIYENEEQVAEEGLAIIQELIGMFLEANGMLGGEAEKKRKQ